MPLRAKRRKKWERSVYSRKCVSPWKKRSLALAIFFSLVYSQISRKSRSDDLNQLRTL